MGLTELDLSTTSDAFGSNIVSIDGFVRRVRLAGTARGSDSEDRDINLPNMEYMSHGS